MHNINIHLLKEGIIMDNVSIVVPIFNAEKTLGKCIKSILKQTFTNFELILVNDGSKDISLDICSFYAEKDKRIKIIDKNNEGSIKTRKRGVEVSRSNYVTFVDADDWLHPKAIEILYNEAMKSGADITVCNTYKVLSDRAIVKRKNRSIYFQKDKVYEGEEIREKLVVAYFYGHPFPAGLCAKLYKKNLLLENGNYLDRIHFLGEDLFYNLEIFIKVNKVSVISKALYYYRTGGYSSKYMPYIFEDAISGYEIQKEVIGRYYMHSIKEQYNGISIMLLNTFKTCLYNCFNNTFNNTVIKEMISEYIQNKSLIEALDNDGVKEYFEEEYLKALRNKDIEYLYKLGKEIYKKRIPRQVLINAISRLPIA